VPASVESVIHRGNADRVAARIVAEGANGPITPSADAILADRGIARVDHVISGLPVPSFPKDLQRDLFRNVRTVLDPSGTYNQITELPWVYWRFYRRVFERVQFRFEPRNFPPAGAYFCRGVKDDV